ncbi:hypothetical protein HMSSN036_22970 [Paenibacillus macerans]|nr:hypothetical protein HMSSN036_22970 [Paenibacillus macerans]
MTANGASDVPERDSLFAYAMVPRASWPPLHGEPNQMSGIKSVHSTPAVAALADIRRDTFFLSDRDNDGDKPLHSMVVNTRRKTDNGRTNAVRCERECGIF